MRDRYDNERRKNSENIVFTKTIREFSQLSYDKSFMALLKNQIWEQFFTITNNCCIEKKEKLSAAQMMNKTYLI